MASRKEAVEPTPYDMGFGSEDVQLPRLRVVGKLSKLVELDVAKSGNIAIGADAEDTESDIIDALNGKQPLRIYVLAMRANYACGFGAVQQNPQLAGTWDEGDPSMPPEAKRQYNYTLFVPEHSTILPVVYTASSTAAREGRKVNSKLQVEALAGRAPYETCFEMSTKVNTAGNNSWPGPDFKLAEAKPEEVATAKRMHDEMGFGVQRKALTPSTDSTPEF